MKVRTLMVNDPITIPVDATIQQALHLMKSKGIRHLPVIGSGRALLGIVTLAGLREALLPAMLDEVSLRDVMVTTPVIVKPDDDIETAARLIYHYKISGLPVVERDQLVGILTETDLLRAFIDMLGLLDAGSRLEVLLGGEPDDFQRAFQTIRDHGGELVNVTMSERREGGRVYYFRLVPCHLAPIRQALETAGFTVLDAVD